MNFFFPNSFYFFRNYTIYKKVDEIGNINKILICNPYPFIKVIVFYLNDY